MDATTALILLAGSAASSAASMYNNQQSIKYASEANDTSISLANTAHQREIRDLEAAGLNPILSSSSSGAATPQLRTPGLESIDGGIASSAGSVARAMNGMVDAELESAKADASTAKAYADNAEAVAEAERIQQEAVANAAKSDAAGWIYDGVNNQLDAMARYEALSGNQSESVAKHITTKEGWKTYNNLVQQYRNEIETGRYRSAIGRAVVKDVAEGASSAGSLYRDLRGRKSTVNKNVTIRRIP